MFVIAALWVGLGMEHQKALARGLLLLKVKSKEINYQTTFPSVTVDVDGKN